MTEASRASTWWLIVLAAVFVACLAPWKALITPAQSFTAMMVAECLFVMLIWPSLGAPGWRAGETTAGLQAVGGGMIEIVLLPVLAGPLVVFAVYISETGLWAVVASHLYVVLLAVWMCSIGVSLAGVKARSAHYQVAVLALCGLPPMVHYLASELTGAGLGWLRAISPVWMMGSLAQGEGMLEAAVGAACFGGCAIAAWLLTARRSSGVVASD